MTEYCKTYYLSLCRYQGKEGWAPASYLKKSDVSSQKMSSHSSANDLDGACKQISNKENQRERFSPFNDKKSAFKNLLDFFFFKKTTLSDKHRALSCFSAP